MSKMPCCWSSGITECLNIDFERAAVTVHVTSPVIDCPSKKKDPIMNLAVCYFTPNGDFRKMQQNSVDNMSDLFGQILQLWVLTSPFK